MSNDKAHDKLDVLFTAKVDGLTDKQIRERWMALQPSGGLVMLSLFGLMVSFLYSLSGEWKVAGLSLAGSIVLTAGVYLMESFRASRRTRQQMIEEIHQLEENIRDSHM